MASEKKLNVVLILKNHINLGEFYKQLLWRLFNDVTSPIILPTSDNAMKMLMHVLSFQNED